MRYTTYRFFSHILQCICYPVAFLYVLFSSSKRFELQQRLGIYQEPVFPREQAGNIWIHAASVGEIQVAAGFITKLAAVLPHITFTLSTNTRHGLQRANDLNIAGTTCIYSPADLPHAVQKAINSIKPAMYICMETEIWPNMIDAASKCGALLVLVNGRISQKSFQRYRHISKLIKESLEKFSYIAVISKEDKKRFVSLGAPEEKTGIFGNAKYDLMKSHLDAPLSAGIRNRLNIRKNQVVLIGGSTHADEETVLLDVYDIIKKRIPDIVLILAPRHLKRVPEIQNILHKRHTPFSLFSETATATDRQKVVVVDTIGDLASIYSLGKYIFVGGSLVAKGGHNLLEAAVWGKPVFYGPCVIDFADAKELLEPAGGGFMISSGNDLVYLINHFEDFPEQYAIAGETAQKIARSQYGSLARQTEIIRKLFNDNLNQKEKII